MSRLFNLTIGIFLVLFVATTVSTDPSWGEDSHVLDNGNALLYLLTSVPPDQKFAEYSVSMQVHLIGMNSFGFYDAVCLYRNNVGCRIFDGDALRRPDHEHTLRNMNIAAVYTYYRMMEKTLPYTLPELNHFCGRLGLDMNDRNTSLETPIGIGNTVATKTLESFQDDGMNILGDHPDSIALGKNYSDYTGYSPVNTPSRYIFKNKWVPALDYDPDTYKYSLQTFMTPQMGSMKTFGEDVLDIPRNPYWARITHIKHHAAYKKFIEYTHEVIEAQQQLTDARKMITELWDSKVFGPPRLVGLLSNAPTNLVDFIEYNLVANRAIVDSFASSWKAKARYDRVRPFTIINEYMADDDMLGLAKPGEGLQMIKGREWRSYAYTDAHPEYPSGTACMCYSMVSALRSMVGSDELPVPFQVPIAAGTSVREPGATPQHDIVLGPYHNFTSIAKDCAESRIWGGVHFRDAIEETEVPCTEIGSRVYQQFQNMKHGQ